MEITRFVPGAMDEEQQALYDAIAGGPRAANRSVPVTGADGSLEGPFNALLLSPRLGTAVQALGAALRFESSLPSRARELVVLTVAHEMRSGYEWAAHRTIGLASGLRVDDVDRVAEGRSPDDPFEAAAVGLATALLAGRATDADPGRVALESALGARAVFEITVFVGYYRMLAQQMAIFEVNAPDAASPP